jgi:hypothetical protein
MTKGALLDAGFPCHGLKNVQGHSALSFGSRSTSFLRCARLTMSLAPPTGATRSLRGNLTQRVARHRHQVLGTGNSHLPCIKTLAVQPLMQGHSVGRLIPASSLTSNSSRIDM